MIEACDCDDVMKAYSVCRESIGTFKLCVFVCK